MIVTEPAVIRFEFEPASPRANKESACTCTSGTNDNALAASTNRTKLVRSSHQDVFNKKRLSDTNSVRLVFQRSLGRSYVFLAIYGITQGPCHSVRQKDASMVGTMPPLTYNQAEFVTRQIQRRCGLQTFREPVVCGFAMV